MPMLSQQDGPTACRPEEAGRECYPPRTELLRNHEINIQFFSAGCVVRVGCRTVAFRDVTEAMNEVNRYVANPEESIKRWNAIFNKNE